MLTYVLALIVGLGSLAIYITAFFFPEIHRKNDFIWSGVGLFYALVLWIFAPRITGGLLLGHVASVALLVWFGWQTLSLRRQLTPEVQQTPIPSPELVKMSIQEQVSNFAWREKLGQLPALIGGVFSGVKGKLQQTMSKKPPAPIEKPTAEIIDQRNPVPEQPIATEALPAEALTVPAPEKPVDSIPTTETEAPAAKVSEEVTPESDNEAKTENVPEATPPNPPTPELVAEAQTETEEKQPIPVEEIAPDAVLAPPAEAPPEKLPPNSETGD
ncbi:Ycf66 family protein [Anabaena cylindrica UHCC 0172]|uniref:Ycf66 family protein n=1 Tax=Anabaena cylindrica TaxID=1165 RepID=UPI002B1EEC4E|nr:Ycf66 family protein [Anabaena cylindrica]MEA5549845.1 Ycf66 family protein [Anabaena cylindrica UHCC 0172]